MHLRLFYELKIYLGSYLLT